MKIEGWRYDVKVWMEFTGEEVDCLILRAKNHYDYKCQAAGMSCEEGGFSNGFIAQLKMFPGPAAWTSDQLDTALKVLERYTTLNDSALRDKLHTELCTAYFSLQVKYAEANNV